MDGLWTWVIPIFRVGGTVTIRDGKAVGGDGCYYYVGTAEIDGEQLVLEMDAKLFNPDGLLGNVWGDNSPGFHITVEAQKDGDTWVGQARRDWGDAAVTATFTRRADAP